MSGCSHFDQGRCRSCTDLLIPREEQLRLKTERLKQITGLTPESAEASAEWGFRDKVKLSVSGTIDQPLVGLLKEDLSEVTELLDCRVQSPILNQELPALKVFIKKWKLTPYQIATKKGELKGLILSYSPTTKQKMIRFVLRSKEALDRIRQGIGELHSFNVISVNIQPIAHALLEGPEEIILSEQNALLHQCNDLQLAFSPQSFMQTNSAVAEKLYATATDWSSPWREGKALDLFCGVGGFALHLAKQGQPVCGVEINKSAVALANQMSELQKLNARFIASPSESIEQIWRDWGPQLVIVNPPRRGLAASRSLIERMAPEALIYSSCSPESLELDIHSLKKSYGAVRTKVFDMFPNTHHFESLTLLVRR